MEHSVALLASLRKKDPMRCPHSHCDCGSEREVTPGGIFSPGGLLPRARVTGEARSQMLRPGGKPGRGPGSGDPCQRRGLLCKEPAGVAGLAGQFGGWPRAVEGDSGGTLQ